jgi:ribokinase
MLGEKFDVVTIGTALLDVYMKSDKFVKVSTGDFAGGVALCEEYGGKTEVQEVEVVSGGGATNNAVSFVRKGLNVAIIAELGQDLVAATIEEELRRERVDAGFLVKEKLEETGISSIMVSSDGGRSVAVYRGAASMLEKRDIPWDQLYPKWIHLSSLGADMEVYEGIIGHAKAMGIKIAVNPGKYEIEHAREWGGMKLFEGVDVLLVNREEASALSGIDFGDDKVWQGDQQLPGPKRWVITDGKNGGKVGEAGKTFFYDRIEVETIEETGAGDAFGSGLVAGLILGKEIEEAIDWGRKQAASVVQYMGAKKGLLSITEISEK